MTSAPRHFLLPLAAAFLLALMVFVPGQASARGKRHHKKGVCAHAAHPKKCRQRAAGGGKRAGGKHPGSGVRGATGSGPSGDSGTGTVSANTVSGHAAGPRTACPDAMLVPASDNVDRINASVLCMVNEQRAKNGLGSLVGNATLARVAVAQSQAMVASNFFNHVGPDGRDAVQRILGDGYVPATYGYEVGENLAWGTQALAAPAYIVANWMNSPEHRTNILNPKFKDTGVSVIASVPALAGAAQGAMYSQEFGALVAPSVPIPQLP